MVRIVALLSTISLVLVACGKSSPACKGTQCMQVAGTYGLTVTQTPATTCKYISYGAGAQAQAQITQDGSKLTLVLAGGPVPETISGTLDVNNSASFANSLAVTITNLGTNMSHQYQDSSDITLNFSDGGMGLLNVTGTISDSLTNTMPDGTGTPAPTCLLEGTVAGAD